MLIKIDSEKSKEKEKNNISEVTIITLPFSNVSDAIFPILKYMYTGKIELNRENCILITATSELLKITRLQSHCADYITATFQRENSVELLTEAIKYDAPNFLKLSITSVARNFYHLKTKDILRIDYVNLIEILSQNNFKITDEYQLYLLMCDYCDFNSENLNQTQILNLMSQIRLIWLTFEQLENVSKDKRVPRNLLIESVMIKLIDHELSVENAAKRLSLIPKKLFQRTNSSIEFEFKPLIVSNKNDPIDIFCGLIGWISTDFGKSIWKNAHNSGKVKVHSSSLTKGSRATLVEKTPAEVWTNDMPCSWISIDLGPFRRLNPTYYTLRHGLNFKADSLRTWDLQASNDGINWKILKKHSNDQSLNAPFAVFSWPIILENDVQSYRFFRVFQTGHNSSNHNFLALSGFEFYGLFDISE